MTRKTNEEQAGLISIIKKYIDLKAEYYRLSFVEKVSVLIGKVVLYVVASLLGLALLMLFILLVHSVLTACIDTEWVVSLIEIGFVVLLATMLWRFRYPLIIHPVANSIVRSLMEQDGNDKEEENEY